MANQPRREFDLPERDVEYLDGLGLPWETVAGGPLGWVIIQGFKIQKDYKPRVAETGLCILPDYQEGQIDMVYFNPALSLTNGRSIVRATTVQFDDREWQQWSRHRTKQNPWRPGLDDISTHMALVETWLKREVTRK